MRRLRPDPPPISLTEPTDLYLVWNETVNSDHFALDPIAPLSQALTLLANYSRTFTLGL